MSGRDYADENVNLFAEYHDEDLFDEEDEEMGIDYFTSNPEPSKESSEPVPEKEKGHIHVSGPPVKISAKRALPDVFKKQGVTKALLILKNGKVVLLT